MRRFRWQQGRQGTGYRKLLLAQGRRWDLYVLDYPAGTSIPTHVDPVPGQRHWRANLVVWGERAFEGEAAPGLLRLRGHRSFRPGEMLNLHRVPSARASLRRARPASTFQG